MWYVLFMLVSFFFPKLLIGGEHWATGETKLANYVTVLEFPNEVPTGTPNAKRESILRLLYNKRQFDSSAQHLQIPISMA